MTGDEVVLQCPCGKEYRDPMEYKLLFVKKEQCEIVILCSNPVGHLKGLGYIKFKIDKTHRKVHVEITSLYSPYVTWNNTRLGNEKAVRLPESRLRFIPEKRIDWKRIMGEAPLQLYGEARD